MRMCRHPLECAPGHVSVGARLLHVPTSLRLYLPEVVCRVWEAGSRTRRVGLPPQSISSSPRTTATAGRHLVENDRDCSASSSNSGHAAFRAPHTSKARHRRSCPVPALPPNAIGRQDERLLRLLPVTQYSNPMLSLSV
jgi:hypothetical protein